MRLYSRRSKESIGPIAHVERRGLGLAIVREIMNAHRGSISFEQSPAVRQHQKHSVKLAALNPALKGELRMPGASEASVAGMLEPAAKRR